MTKKTIAAFAVVGSLLAGAGVALANEGDGKPPFEGKFAERKAEMLKQYDANKDGKLDDAERKVMRDELAKKRFEKLDTNHDGQLSIDEFKAGMPDHPFGRRHHGEER